MTQHRYQCEDCGHIFDGRPGECGGQGEEKCPQCGGDSLRETSPALNACSTSPMWWPRGGG